MKRTTIWAALALLLAMPAAADIRETGGGGAGDGGTATNAAVQPWHLSAMGSMLYVSSQAQQVVRRILPDGTIELVAGTYVARTPGDPLPPPGVLSPATGTRLLFVTGVAADVGETYFSAGGTLLVVQAGAIRTVATGFANIGGLAIAGDWLYVAADGQVLRYGLPCAMTCGAPTVLASGLTFPTGLAVGPDGAVYVSEQAAGRVKRIPPGGGVPVLVAGTGAALGDGGLATSANLSQPEGLALDGNGDLYIADRGHARVRRIRAGIITTVAGTGAENRFNTWVEPSQVGHDPLRQPLTPAGLAIVGRSLWIASGYRLYALDLSAAQPTITAAAPTSTATAAPPTSSATATVTATAPPTLTRTATRTPTTAPTCVPMCLQTTL